MRLTHDRSAEERASDRVRRIAATAGSSALAALVQLVVGLVGVRVCLRYLGAEQYGLWMTVSSMTAMLAFADFGMGNGLLNAIARANGRDNREAAASATSSAFVLLTGLGLILSLLLAIGYPLVRWDWILNASGPTLRGLAARVMAVTLACAFISLPLGIVQRVQMGYQEGFINSRWNALGSLLGLIALLAGIHARATLPWLVLCAAGAPVVALALNGVALFGYRRPQLRPRSGLASTAEMRHLLRAGSLFFAIQLAGVIGYQLPLLAISHLLGPSAVTAFSVPLRLFMVMPTLVGFFLTPLWPAYREALERGDGAWVSRTVGSSVAISLAANMAWSVALVLLGPAVLHWWVGPSVSASLGLRLGLAGWATLTGLGGPFAMFLNGAGALRFQAACAWLMAIASLGLCFVLIPRLGVAGAAYAMVLAQAVCVLAPSMLYVPRQLSRLLVPTEGQAVA